MSGYQPQPSSASRVVRGLRELLFAEDAISEAGSGQNVVQVMDRIATALEKIGHQWERYNDRRDREDGAA